MALGWIGAITVRLGRQGVERLMLALDGRALWAAGAAQACPEAHEAEERSIISQGEKCWGLARLRFRIFAERRRRDVVAILGIRAPVRLETLRMFVTGRAPKFGGP